MPRSLSRIAPTWSIQEASNGETVLRMTASEQFDLIFLDQCMASIDKQLLGTETARAMRAKGVQSRICGLSGNDIEEPFRNAGADAFILKPFSCEQNALKREVQRILEARQPQIQEEPLIAALPSTAGATISPSPAAQDESMEEANDAQQVPKNISVLVVDDDALLRKLICRSLHRIAPTWSIQQAVNGETALRMCETERYDLIFIDQYMPSTERQLLGTEAVTGLRDKGVTSIICGLSANAMGTSFLDAGADAFVQKPFPCEKSELTREVLRVLNSRQ